MFAEKSLYLWNKQKIDFPMLLILYYISFIYFKRNKGYNPILLKNDDIDTV